MAETWRASVTVPAQRIFHGEGSGDVVMDFLVSPQLWICVCFHMEHFQVAFPEDTLWFEPKAIQGSLFLSL